MGHFTITFDSRGNHGHKLNDYLGGRTIGMLYGLKFVHTRFPYLDFFGVGRNAPCLNPISKRLKYRNKQVVKGPIWHGIQDYQEFRDHFDPILLDSRKRTLFIFHKALRVMPYQTIPWYNEGLIDLNVFEELRNEMSFNFQERHNLSSGKINKDKIRVAIHINRGSDYDREKYPKHFSDPNFPRYIFPMSYFENIIEQLEARYGKAAVHFEIYTETLNSDVIVNKFGSKDNVTVNLGPNREDRDYHAVHDIFLKFVQADILVSCNSNFSSMCTYFRKDKQTIYHPFSYLKHLPEPEYLATDLEGNFSTKLLHDI